MGTHKNYFLTRLGCSELLGTRLMLSAVGFVSHDIAPTADVPSPSSVFAADLDGDGDPDLLVASSSESMFAWYENVDGQGSFAKKQIIEELNGAYSIFYVSAADIDGDGDNDVMATTRLGMAWYENQDGAGAFGAANMIPDLSGPVLAADVDGDNDLDIVATRRGLSQDQFVWLGNTNGKGAFSDAKVISTQPGLVRFIDVMDVDGDGDNDLLSVSGNLAWHENVDGMGAFGDPQVIAPVKPNSLALTNTTVSSADMDGDGDVDVVFSTRSESTVKWYENTDGRGSFGGENQVSDNPAWVTEALAVDLDGDGDIDVLSSFPSSVVWQENTDGQGTFGTQHVVSSRDTVQLHSTAILATDIDGDADVDVVELADGRIAWYENRLIGDADDDGMVDFADFLSLSANFGRATDAVWEDGDFNLDGMVNFADFLLLSAAFGETRG